MKRKIAGMIFALSMLAAFMLSSLLVVEAADSKPPVITENSQNVWNKDQRYCRQIKVEDESGIAQIDIVKVGNVGPVSSSPKGKTEFQNETRATFTYDSKPKLVLIEICHNMSSLPMNADISALDILKDGSQNQATKSISSAGAPVVPKGYHAQLKKGQNTEITDINGFFGEISRGSIAVINESVRLRNIGDTNASVGAGIENGVNGTSGLTSEYDPTCMECHATNPGTLVLPANNIAFKDISASEYEWVYLGISGGGTTTLTVPITEVSGGSTMTLSACLYYPPDQHPGEYRGNVSFIFADAPKK